MCGCIRMLRTYKSLQRTWHIRLSSSSSSAPSTPGIPYTKISIGIPKEIWHDERRLVYDCNFFFNCTSEIALFLY